MSRIWMSATVLALVSTWGCSKEGDTGEDTGEAPPPPRLSGALSMADADASLLPVVPPDTLEDEEIVTNLGIAVSGAGDVNGDGHRDVLVGADGGYGAVYLFQGPFEAGQRSVDEADATVIGVEEGEVSSLFGLTARGAGDLNQDGYDDILMTDADYSGDLRAVFILHGPVSDREAHEDFYDVRLMGTEVPYAGIEAVPVGDVDGDGAGDLLVGSDKEPANGEDSGAAWLILGPAIASGDLDSQAAAVLMGASGYDLAGAEVAGAGDVDGDGLADLLVGATMASSGSTEAGAAYLVLAPVTGDLDLDDAHAKFVGLDEKDEAGAAVAGVGDVDGDGLDDFLIGAPGIDSADPNAGGAYLVLDDDDKNRYLDDLIAFTGAAQGDGAGEVLTGAGDLDGDGFADLLIGAPRESSGGEDTGAAYLIYGGPDMASLSLGDAGAALVGAQGGDDAGGAVAGLGDIDGDGFDDIAVGANSEPSVLTNGGAVYLFFGGPPDASAR